MNLATLEFRSRALQRHVTYSAILPEGGRGPYPVLLQLHGYSDDHRAWLTRSNLARHVAPYQMIVVLPDGGTSFYLNLGEPGAGSLRYEDFVMRDLREHVAATFQVRPGKWAIGGLSMGGYGAMRLGCSYPDVFASVWAHSSIFPTLEELGTGRPSWGAAAPHPLEDAYVYAITRRLAAARGRPEIAFDCGTDDHLIEDNRRLHAHLESLGVPHHYAEHPGAHTWDYWDEHVREALGQHARVLKVERTPEHPR